MKRADEEYCKDTFSTFLARHFAGSQVSWSEVPQNEEPPDYYLTIDGKRYAVEVTSLIDDVIIGESVRMSNVGARRSLVTLCEDMKRNLAERGLLFGAHVMTLQPIEGLRDLRPLIEKRVIEYVQRTRFEKAAAREVLVRKGRARIAIQKHHDQSDQLYWVISGGAKWEGQMRHDIARLLEEALRDKRRKLREVETPIILLLLDRYHHGSAEMWKDAADDSEFGGFQIVARIWQDDTMLLHSSSSWPWDTEYAI
ncbi:MAG TPA: hypothetical protein VEK15_24760 [Vicinamibacteria bacterium]|nr:hypothetical protein [Vicinamibacteria bacterium]